MDHDSGVLGIPSDGMHHRVRAAPVRSRVANLAKTALVEVSEDPSMYKPSAPPGSVARPESCSTILLTEDDRTVRELVRFLLELEGYEVLEADCGETALQLATRHQGAIHLLLTDVMMPGLTGDRLAEQLMTVRPQLRVLFMSGQVGRDIIRTGSPFHQAGFIRKPFSPAALARSVRDTLSALPPG
jgi:CheY-like chemotaxis protein